MRDRFPGLDDRPSGIDLGGADRWLGGVHLEGREVRWRRDQTAGRVARQPGR